MKSRSKSFFFGDSITELGIKEKGYISLLNEKLKVKNKTQKYSLFGSGISGNKVYDLFFRMEKDVFAQKPDVVVIWVGVNDVWHKAGAGTGTDADKFGNFYTAIIKKLQSQGIRVICCTPAAIGERTDNSNQQDGDLNHYSNIIRTISSKFDCPLIDLRKEFIGYNLKNNPTNKESGILTTDRVHLNETGNQFVADLMMKAVVK